jgi:DNA-binding transcriptional regulator GbsR (MarR family)
MKEDTTKSKIYSTFANIANSLGYSEVYGRTIACLLTHDGPVPLSEVAKETGYSSSMVSLSIDFLETVGMVKRVKKPGDRKLYLQSAGSLLDGLKRAILVRIEKNVLSSLQEFDEYKKELKKLSGEESKRLLKAIEKLEHEIKRMDGYIKVLSRVKLP